MNEEYFSFGEKEISWLKGRDPELVTVISRMEKPQMNRRLFDFLIVNVVFNYSFRFIAYASNKVGKTPEIRLPIIRSQLRTEEFPDLP